MFSFSEVSIFLLMVFISIFALTFGTSVPVFGDARKTRKLLRKRLAEIEATSGREQISSLLRAQYLTDLSPLERGLESLPGMEKLAELIEQSGRTWPAYRVVGAGILLGAVGALVAWSFTHTLALALLLGMVAFSLPFLKIISERNQRMAKFEEQLPEALDVIKRALRAGHPFNQSIKLVSEEMDDPIAKEFGITFADINYGNDVKAAMLGLLERIPSVTVMAVVTSVLVQKETGGNLAEILEKISEVIRGRFRLQRKVKTLSAEGRLSAWILVSVPFVLFIMITITTPDYLPILLEEPQGRKLIAWGFGIMLLGILWIRRIIRIDV